MGEKGSHRGLSLLEVVISTALLGVVLVSSAHVINVSSRSAESVHERIAPQIDALHIASQMRDELATSTAVTWAGGSSISFAVPDRDNDSLEETVSYHLDSGQLIRTYNGSAAPMMDAVDDLRFEYRLRISDEDVTETVTDQSAEIVLASHDGYSGQDYYYAYLELAPSQQWAHQFEVTGLPQAAVSFDITRISIRGWKDYFGAHGALFVSMERPISASKGWPDGNVLDQATMDISAMSTSPGWHHLEFSNLDEIPVTDNAFTVRILADDIADYDVKVVASFVDDPPGPDDGQQVYWTYNGGSSWTPSSVNHNGDLRYYLYGHYNTLLPVTTTVRVTRIIGVQVSLTPQAADVPARRFAQLANEPACDMGLAEVDLSGIADAPVVVEDARVPPTGFPSAS
jgi:hypothetical protein